jgi:hypothetical protein
MVGESFLFCVHLLFMEGDGLSDYKTKKEQLFKAIPSIDFVEDFLKMFVPNGFSDTCYQFSRRMMEEKQIVKKVEMMLPLLRDYYLKCKHKRYLENLNEKKCITLLRQLLRVYGYKIVSIEKYHQGQKYLLYKMERILSEEMEEEDRQKKLIVKFD